jgi:nucleoside-diphosphate kinase
MAEQTLVLFKPDAIERRLVGTLLQRFERKGLQIAAMKFMKVTQDMAELHYFEHRERPFFKELIEYITKSPVLALILRGEGAIAAIRALNGATNPIYAVPGSIRGDFALSTRFNLVHASDSAQSSAREIKIFFTENEIF